MPFFNSNIGESRNILNALQKAGKVCLDSIEITAKHKSCFQIGKVARDTAEQTYMHTVDFLGNVLDVDCTGA